MERYISQKGKIKKWEIPVGIFLALLFITELGTMFDSVWNLSSFMSVLFGAAIFGLPMALILRGVYYKTKARVINRALEHEKDAYVSFSTIEARTGIKEAEKVLYTLSSMGYMQNVLFDFREDRLELEDLKRASASAFNTIRSNYAESAAYQTRSSFGSRSMGGDSAFREMAVKSVTCPHCGAALRVPAGGSVVCEYCESVVNDPDAGNSSSGTYSYGTGAASASAASDAYSASSSASSVSTASSGSSVSDPYSSGSNSSNFYSYTSFKPSAGSRLKPKNKWVSFFLCIFFGMIGAHKFYEGKILMGIAYLFTLGFFSIGVFVDLFLILLKPNPYYV